MVMRSIPAWLVATGALGCAPDEPPEIPPITWVGEHLEYAPQDGAPEPCAGTLPYMDRFVERIADELGVELERPVVFVHGEGAGAVCDDPGTYGCGFDGGVYARGVPMEHELVHGVQRQYGGSMRFFEEGTAEAFGDDMRGSTRVPASGDVVDGMLAGSNRKLPLEWYPRAGHFAAYLHERYGAEVTTALLLQTDFDSTAGMAVTVIERTTGLTFESILADYSVEPTCRQRQYGYPLVPCGQPADLRLRCDGTVELGPVRVACDDPSTLGPREYDGMFRYLTLEVERGGLYAITAFDEGQRFVPFSLKECALGCDSILAGHAHAEDVSPMSLRPGRYVLKLSRFTQFPVDVVVTIEGLGCG
jgi:hypothetical protein